MKAKPFDFVLIILAAMFMFSLKYFQEDNGPHGGRVKQAGKYHIELSYQAGGFYTWLLDSKRKTVDNRHVSCELVLIMDDGTTAFVKMKPMHEDGFAAELVPLSFKSCRVTYYISKDEVSAEFFNETVVVKK